MSTPETSKDWLQPKAPTAEQARHAVILFRNGQGSMPVTVTNVDDLVVLQAGLNPGLTLVLTQPGAEKLGEQLLAASGKWRRVDQDIDFSKYDRVAEPTFHELCGMLGRGGTRVEPSIDIAGQDTQGEDIDEALHERG